MWFISAIVLLAAGSAYGTPGPGPAPACPLDICFLVDSSSSIGRPNWNAFVLPFLKNIINALNNAGFDINVGIQRFSHKDVNPDLYLTNVPTNLNHVLDTVDDLVFLKGFTDIGTGMRKCQDLILGGANNRPEAPDVIVLLSDGVPTRNTGDTIPAADYVKDPPNNTTVISVAVGTFSMAILETIASPGFPVLSVVDFNSLANLINDLFFSIAGACPDDIPPTPSPTPPPPVPATGICLGCDGSSMPTPDIQWGQVDMIWIPDSPFNPPDPQDAPPSDLFAFEQYVLYDYMFTQYTDNEIPGYTP